MRQKSALETAQVDTVPGVPSTCSALYFSDTSHTFAIRDFPSGPSTHSVTT
jgi:hypothetical protein